MIKIRNCELNLNRLTCRLFAWSILSLVAVFATLYILAWWAKEPVESPLVGAIALTTTLNNGEPVITINLILLLTLDTLVILAGLFAKNSAIGLALLMFGQSCFTITVVKTTVTILFTSYAYLYSVMQPLINHSYRLRVIFASIRLECEQHTLGQVSEILKRDCVTVIWLSYVVAGAIEYIYSELEKMERKRP